MINCPSCKMSNLGSTHCVYCKAELPAREDETSSFASVTHYADVPSAMTATVAVETSRTEMAGTTRTAVAEPPPPPPPVPEPKPKKTKDKALKALHEYESRKGTDRSYEHPEPERWPSEAQLRGKGPFVTETIMSAILPGLGQVAKGMPERGFLLLAAIQVAGLFQWTWLVVAIWIYAVFDAYSTETDPIGDRLRQYLRDLRK